MIKVTELEASNIKDTMKRSILLPDKRDDLVAGEIHSLYFNGACSPDYVLVYVVAFGTLKHWLHDRSTLQDHGFAQPHELADYLKRLHLDLDHKFDDEHEVWTRISVQAVYDWESNDPVKMQEAIMNAQFLTDYNESLKES